MASLDEKIIRLRRLFHELGSVVVCFSGGVDSGYLLAEAVRTLRHRAVALTALSPSLAPEEGTAARELAAWLGARHELVKTAEVDDPRYAANPVNRCYFCKTEVYGEAVTQAKRLGISHVIDGFNVNDRELRDAFDAGLKLLQESGEFDAIVTKWEGNPDIVRATSRELLCDGVPN